MNDVKQTIDTKLNRNKQSQIIMNTSNVYAMYVMYGLFFCIPCVYIVAFQWFASVTSVVWYQLILSWTAPTAYVFVIIHPVRRIYSLYILSLMELPSNYSSSVVMHIISILLGDTYISYYIWPCLMMCMAAIELVSNSMLENDTTITLFTSIHYGIILIVVLFLVVWVVSVNHTVYKNSDLLVSYHTETPSDAYSLDRLFAISLLIGIFAGYILLGWIPYYFSDTNVNETLIVSLYILLCIIVIGILCKNLHASRNYMVFGICAYVVLLCLTFTTCTLFTMSYNYYLTDNMNSSMLFLLYVLFLIISQLIYQASHYSLKQICGPYLHKQYLYPQLLLTYACQFAVFGFTPLSWQFVVLNIISVVHQVMRSSNVYTWLITKCVSKSSQNDNNSNAKLFEAISVILSDQQIYSQEWLCVIQSLISLTILVYWFRWQEINSNFCNRFVSNNSTLGLSIFIQFIFRVMSWFITSNIVSHRLKNMITIDNIEQLCIVTKRNDTMSCMLPDFVSQNLRIPQNSKWYVFVETQYIVDHLGTLNNLITCNAHETTQRLLSSKSMSVILKQYFMYFVLVSCLIYTFLMLNHISCPFRYMILDLVSGNNNNIQKRLCQSL